MQRPPGQELLARARGLRRGMTPQEQVLWTRLRGRRLQGFKFRRQMWLAGYIVDFACPAARLVVEADGSQHSGDRDYDEARAAALARLGWRTLRFWNNEIDLDPDGVMTAILAALGNSPSPSHALARAGPSPSPAGRGVR